MEHLRHFGLTRDPFANDPHAVAYFESAEHLRGERRLRRAIAQKKGLTLVIGPPGSGKTLLLRRLLDQLEEEVYEVVLLVPLKGIADSSWILTRFARQLGIEVPATDRAALLGQLYEQLAIVREDGRHTVLMLDEGQVVADSETLQELRGLLNLEYEDQRLLSVVLVGLPDLDAAIARDASLAGRVDVRVPLGRLSRSEAAEYLAHRVRAAGGDPAIFRQDAVSALVHHGAGCPRLLGTLADNALFEAYLAGQEAVTAGDVATAVRQLDPTADASEVEAPLAGAPPGADRPAEAGPHPPPPPELSLDVELDEPDLDRAAAEFGARPAARPARLPDDEPPTVGDARRRREREARPPNPGVARVQVDSTEPDLGDSGRDVEALFEGLGAEPDLEPLPGNAGVDDSKDDDEIDGLFVELVEE